MQSELNLAILRLRIMKTNLLSVAVVLFLVLCASANAQAPPLVDGDCGEYAGLKAKTFVVSDDVALLVYQDKHFVWLCYGYPEGSFAMADLKLKTKTFPAGINLHVSAQLGEWPLDKPELAPKNAESDLWWNHKQWTANTVWINGMDRTGDTPRYKFKNAKAREIQIAKMRFGKGTWQFSIEIRNIMGKNGRTYNAAFPKSGEHKIKIS